MTHTRVVAADRFVEALGNPRFGFELDETTSGYRRNRVPWAQANRRWPRHILHLVLKERWFGRFNDRQVVVNPGELVWIAPHAEHDVKWANGYSYVGCMFSLFDGDT